MQQNVPTSVNDDTCLGIRTGERPVEYPQDDVSGSIGGDQVFFRDVLLNRRSVNLNHLDCGHKRGTDCGIAVLIKEDTAGPIGMRSQLIDGCFNRVRGRPNIHTGREEGCCCCYIQIGIRFRIGVDNRACGFDRNGRIRSDDITDRNVVRGIISGLKDLVAIDTCADCLSIHCNRTGSCQQSDRSNAAGSQVTIGIKGDIVFGNQRNITRATFDSGICLNGGLRVETDFTATASDDRLIVGFCYSVIQCDASVISHQNNISAAGGDDVGLSVGDDRQQRRIRLNGLGRDGHIVDGE